MKRNRVLLTDLYSPYKALYTACRATSSIRLHRSTGVCSSMGSWASLMASDTINDIAFSLVKITFLYWLLLLLLLMLMLLLLLMMMMLVLMLHMKYVHGPCGVVGMFHEIFRRFCFVLFCCGNMNCFGEPVCFIYPYYSVLLHWHRGNLMIAPVPAMQHWKIWVNAR